jgi:hypothetical protein
MHSPAGICKDDWFKQEQLTRMNLLTNDQKKVIISVIEYLAEKYFNPNFPDEIEGEKMALSNLYRITNLA